MSRIGETDFEFRIGQECLVQRSRQRPVILMLLIPFNTQTQRTPTMFWTPTI